MGNKILHIFVACMFVLSITGGLFLGMRIRNEQNKGNDAGTEELPVVISPFTEEFSAGIDYMVEITDDGFNPKRIVVKQGQIVGWVNRTVRDHWPASAFHPIHGVYPEFDVRHPIPPGSAWAFSFQKIGQWRYHDHLKPVDTGLVKVTE